MNTLFILLIGLSTNLDNLCMAAVFGMQGKRIPVLSNILIALVSGVAACIFCHAGAFLMPAHLGYVSGCLLLIGMGAYTLITAGIQKCAPDSKSAPLSVTQTFVLGCAYALNCLPIAFGTGAMQVSPLWVSLSISVFSFIFVVIGTKLGYRLGWKRSVKRISVLAGVLFIVLGVLALI